MEAYSHQSLCVTAVGRMLNNQKDENWCLPTMYTVCLDLRLVAQKAETVSSGYNFFLIIMSLFIVIVTRVETSNTCKGSSIIVYL